jgi:hypothetical protein
VPAKKKTKKKSRPQRSLKRPRKSPRLNTSQKNSKTIQQSVHPWRVCPYGEHWVRTHPLHVPPSNTFPNGHVTTRREHCARNPSGKDQLYPDEILEITKQHFSKVQNKPCPLPLGFGDAGTMYDDLIGGWVQYWNDVLKPDVPLEPNLVKALIASESSFRANLLANPRNSNSARGLMQILNGSRKILADEKGELKDHFITVAKDELNDPSVNICAGIRWLFQKRKLASSRLNKSATWIETIWEYKGTSLASKERAEKIKRDFNSLYAKYQKCEEK